jgi:hypothetical protein
MENVMKDDETRLKDLLIMQQAQMNILMSVCGALISQRLDCQNILDGLAKYNEQVVDQAKPVAYQEGIASVVKALRSSVEIFRTARLSSELPLSSKLH